MKSITRRAAVERFTRQLCRSGMRRTDQGDPDSLIRTFSGRGIYLRILAGHGIPATVQVCDRKGFDRWANSMNFYAEGIPSNAQEFLRKVTQLRQTEVWNFNQVYPAVQIPIPVCRLSDDVIVEFTQFKPEGIVLDKILAYLLPIGISTDLKEVYCRPATLEAGTRTWIFKIVKRQSLKPDEEFFPHGAYAIALEKQFLDAKS